ncbi:MAG: hypothetical protein AAF485_05025 [Chloroflexota bacterium]
MIKPFHLRNMPLVAHLQQVGVSLDIEEQLTYPRSPLRSLLIDMVFSPRSGPSTFIFDQYDEQGRHTGVAQMRSRPGRAEQDVVFMSPALDSGNGSHAIWQRLLTHLCIQTAEQGCLRLYARLGSESEELQLFKNVGFVEYSQEEIYKLEPAALPPQDEEASLQLRPQIPSDGWGLQKLYTASTPRAVQNSEGLAQGQWALAGRTWTEPGHRAGYVWEDGGELLGALHIRTGHQGHWIQTLLHPDANDQAAALGKAALGLTRSQPQRPVYFAYRHYELGWSAILTDLGFAPLTVQALVVKPMAIRVREPSREQQAVESAATNALGIRQAPQKTPTSPMTPASTTATQSRTEYPTL